MNAPPQGTFEALQGFARYGVDHLLMETRIGVTRSKAAGNQQFRVVEIYWEVVSLGRAVVIDDRESLSDRSRIKFLVTDQRRHVVADKLAQARIKCIDLQRTLVRPGKFVR